MKTLGLSVVSFLLALFSYDGQSDQLVFFEQNTLKTLDPTTLNLTPMGIGIWPTNENSLKTDPIIYSKPDLGFSLRTEAHYLQGIESPYTPGIWYYSDIPNVDVGSKLYRYDNSDQTKMVVFNENQVPQNGHSFLPIGFGANQNTLYLQEMDISTNDEYLGIWKYTITTNTFQKLGINTNYMCTPVLSSDRTKLYYTAASDPVRNVVHGTADLLMEFDLATGTEKTLHTSPGNQIVLIGVHSAPHKVPTITLAQQFKQQTKFANDWRMPMTLGEDWCVTRDGSPRPPNPQTGQWSSSCGYGFSHHGYRATDWSNLNFGSNNGQGPIVATRQGIVVSNNNPGNCGGYGNLVRVSHDLGGGVTWYSYYAHLASVSVNVNQCVGQGEAVGVEGGTNGPGCTPYAVHLHFEVRQSLSGSGQQQWVPFADMNNGYPRQNDRGVSANSPVPCCAANFTTTTGSITGDIYAGTSITSAGTVLNGSNVTLSAGGNVELIPGFEAQTGSILDATIGGCTAKTAKTGTIINSEQPAKPSY